jgi:hypothetical protein
MTTATRGSVQRFVVKPAATGPRRKAVSIAANWRGASRGLRPARPAAFRPARPLARHA